MARLTGSLTVGPVENIGPRERRRRLIAGVAGLAVAFGGLALLVATGVDRTWRVALFLPFWFGALGLAQARART